MTSKVSSMPEILYRQIDAVSSSDLKLLSKNPRQLYLSKQKRDEPNEAFEFGTLFHMAVLETEKFRDSYVCEPDRLPDGRLAGIGEGKINRNTKEWKQFILEWRDQNKGKSFVHPDDFSMLLKMINAVGRHKKAQELLQSGQKEMATLWMDPERKIKCKGKADLISENALTDFKTTKCKSPREFEIDCYRRLVHMQMAYYDWGFAFSGIDFKDHYVIGVEKDYEKQELGVFCMQMTPELIERGHEARQRLLDLYVKCKTKNEWPGFDGVYPMGIPAWATVNIDEETLAV